MGSLEQYFYVSLHQSEYIDSSIAHQLHETISKSITRHVPQQSNDVIATHFLSYTSRSRDFAREFSHRHARILQQLIAVAALFSRLQYI